MKNSRTNNIYHDNAELLKRLQAAEEWIRRSISETQLSKMRAKTKRNTIKDLEITEEDIIQRIKKYFWEDYKKINHENLDILVGSEISFSHIVSSKNIDCMIVSGSYQKILENIFEQEFTQVFRKKNQKARLKNKTNDILEKTLYKVIQSNFSLSIWKIYLILQKIHQENSSWLIQLFRESIENVSLYSILSNWDFWEMFSEIIDTWAFWEKRHQGKLSLVDMRFLRTKITWDYEKNGLIKLILQHIE